jgi:hypothetical protein
MPNVACAALTPLTDSWASDTITYYTNSAGLRSGFSLQQPAGSFTNGYNYDAAHRLSSIVSHSGTYSYHYYPTNRGITAATRLIRKLTLPPGSYLTNLHGQQPKPKHHELRLRLKRQSIQQQQQHHLRFRRRKSPHRRLPDHKLNALQNRIPIRRPRTAAPSQPIHAERLILDV